MARNVEQFTTAGEGEATITLANNYVSGKILVFVDGRSIPPGTGDGTFTEDTADTLKIRAGIIEQSSITVDYES